MKMREAIEFSNLYESIKTLKLPVKTAYKFNRLIKHLEPDLKFYQSTFTSIIEECAKRDDQGQYCYTSDGAGVQISETKQVECNRRISELLDLEITVSGFTFSIDELDGLNLSIAQLESLMSLIVE